MDNELIKISGEIKNYIYETTESMYKVVKIISDDEEITITGAFPHLDEGLVYDFLGYYKENPKYGKQFFVQSYSKSESYSIDGLISYLSSERFYGIGERIATNIVNTLGTGCIDIILKNPERLEEIKGITKAKAQIIYDSLSRGQAEEQIFIKLYSYGLSSKMVGRLYEKYGTKTLNIIEENPYILIRDIEGFGFKRCDNLALNLGFKKNDIRRLKASVNFTLSNICYNYGFTFLTYKQLYNSTIKLLNDPDILGSDIDLAIQELLADGGLVSEDERIYDYALYKAENIVKDRLLKINKNTNNVLKRDDVALALDYVEENLNIIYTPMQKEAIISSLSNKISIITGGPGTGKSTVIKGILNTYAKAHKLDITSDEFKYKVMMAAPTGRAAKRMTEATGFYATTIHKTLGYSLDGEFQHNALSPLTANLLIIDEVSMVDILLAKNLFDSLLSNCQIILVGDSNQLPAVGPGNVLLDLINSNIFKTIKLNQIMRQAEGSDIIKLSNMILQKRIDYRIFSAKKEVFYYPYDSKGIIDGIIKILDNYLAKGGDLFNGIQILVPMYNGVAGIDEINRVVQEKYNPSEKMIVRDDKIFKVNDKVLQLKNDRDLDIMNGDIGKIIDIVKDNEKDYLLINFDDRVLKYPASNLDSLQLAYAISIHKSQGSEFQNVIMPIVKSYNIMLKPKLIYTGITRAKSKVIILGQVEALDYALSQMDDTRQTTLAVRLNEDSNKKIVEKILDPEIPFDDFGEYDMEGITPYTFMD
ncbi:MAG: ATP-dependent RecD-like DNA helicase [Acholeplasmatales bacterium]|nr:ATP-dependent RecD-like DNA helicase [Acholeplasmatales bacterium]